MVQFPYLDEPLLGPRPPSMPAHFTARWRPLIPISAVGPTGRRRFFPRALADSGADDTVLPISIAISLGVSLLSHSGHGIRWRGQSYQLRFGNLVLQLDDGAQFIKWTAVVGFSSAPIKYPILGINGCLQFFGARFVGDRQVLELETNSIFCGTVSEVSS
jgi:hypothetical protein